MPPLDKEERARLPGTLKRSAAKAQRTYIETLESAEEQYGDGARAHQTAFAAVKHTFEKVGDRWEKKDHPGPSDPRAERGSTRPGGKTFGGVNVNQPKKNLLERARALQIRGRSSMTKEELAEAIAKHQ